MPNAALIGRYWPGSSVIHRLDPRTKLGLTLLLLIIIFCAQTPTSLCVCACFVAICFIVAQIPFTQALRSVAPLAFILIITILLNVFWVQGGATLIQWGPFQISEAGVSSAAFIGTRLILLLLSTSLLTLTTTSLDLTDAFERALLPFARIGVPAHELSLIMGLSLRFLPQFIDESKTIRQAQISRGAALTLNPFKGGINTLSSFMVPLFTSVFRHADTLSAAMDARCYHGGPGRTRLHPLCYKMRDLIALLIIIAIFALIIASNFLL